MYTDQRLYRARALEPIAALGDVLFMVDQSGPLGATKYPTPYFALAGIEPVFGVAPHNILLLYTQGAAAPAGYGLGVNNTTTIPEAAINQNLNAGASVTITNPKILQGLPRQLAHLRIALKTLALTGPKEHDIELQMFMPGKLGKFGLASAIPGFLNMVDQAQDPGDVIDSPAQGANQTLPAAFPAVANRDQQNLLEFFLWEINGPTFQIWNNGASNVTGGSIGIRIWGFRYDLVPLAYDQTWVRRWVYGALRPAPPTDRAIVVVPTAPYQAQGSY